MLSRIYDFEDAEWRYLQLANASWDQKYVHHALEIDVGRRVATLHREQSSVLAKLLDGKNIAVSAPTSFGKSFIIDAFIAAKQPDNVVIIVPTIALMDETRRRLFKKFSEHYTIITAPDTRLGPKNILIFPQERALGFLSALETIDLLVVDEFYKAKRVRASRTSADGVSRMTASYLEMVRMIAASSSRTWEVQSFQVSGKTQFAAGDRAWRESGGMGFDQTFKATMRCAINRLSAL